VWFVALVLSGFESQIRTASYCHKGMTPKSRAGNGPVRPSARLTYPAPHSRHPVSIPLAGPAFLKFLHGSPFFLNLRRFPQVSVSFPLPHQYFSFTAFLTFLANQSPVSWLKIQLTQSRVLRIGSTRSLSTPSRVLTVLHLKSDLPGCGFIPLSRLDSQETRLFDPKVPSGACAVSDQVYRLTKSSRCNPALWRRSQTIASLTASFLSFRCASSLCPTSKFYVYDPKQSFKASDTIFPQSLKETPHRWCQPFPPLQFLLSISPKRKLFCPFHDEAVLFLG